MAPMSLRDAGTAPVKGRWYALLADHGEGVGMLTRTYRYTSPSGEEYAENQRQLYVLQVVEPATYGVGYSTEDSVLCMWLDSPSPGRVAVHHLSFPVTQFVELVGEGEEPPEYVALQEQQATVGGV
ncbi:hypothetical protein AB0M10_15445 [Streptomyces sp. NPDC051840]|uniref:hypothetical protein n=1 Tax=Streptomyces sp. NPDC051840 TaxID=3154752 RepID=UPI003412F0ED